MGLRDMPACTVILRLSSRFPTSEQTSEPGKERDSYYGLSVAGAKLHRFGDSHKGLTTPLAAISPPNSPSGPIFFAVSNLHCFFALDNSINRT